MFDDVDNDDNNNSSNNNDTELSNTFVNVQSNYNNNNINLNQSTFLYNATSAHFDFTLYQRALLKRNHTLAEGFRRIYNMTYKP